MMLIGFLCGVLPGVIFGLIGVGSGILAILLVSNVLKLPIHFALPIALLLTFVASLYTISKNFRGVPIQKSGLLIIIAGAVLVAPISVYISEFINSEVLKRIFNIFLIFASFLMWPRKYESNKSEVYLTKKRYLVLLITGILAGTMNALLGVSGGIIIVPALTFSGFDINKSIVTSAYVVLFTTVMSLISYFSNSVLNFY